MNGGAPQIRIAEAGDAAMLIELVAPGAEIDPAINARAIAIARVIQTLAIDGVRDVVPTYRSVAVYFDPLITSARQLHEEVAEVIDARVESPPSRLIEVPVVYGGECGPDLAAVAAHARLSAEAVIERHTAAEYRVFMLGFLPGFAYMGVVDESIAMGRRADPRLRVPAGSVGIAGRQTGVYPMASPGGWQLIGRTGLTLFDAGRVPASLFQAGDRVRFVRAPGPEVPAGDVTASSAPATNTDTAVATVLTPGLLTTVQDLGRWGAQASGVSVSGAMDSVSHRLANVAVGNSPDLASLEATITGPELRFERPARVAMAGADLSPQIDGQRLQPLEPHPCQAGSVLRFAERKAGARTYIAVAGGISAPPVLGSRSTHALTAIGGRVLRAGDTVATVSSGLPVAGSIGRPVPEVPRGGATLRVLRGPQAALFPSASLDGLVRTRFVISPQSNRMAYRLTGESIAAAGDMVSDATFTGAVQVPPSGQPILLMNDRQTVGGYPQIAVVISADLPLAGQLAPGDWVAFTWCSLPDALSALRAQEARLAV